MRRRLLKRSKALTMDLSDKIGLTGRSSTLLSLPEADTDTDLELKAFPNLPDKLLKAVGLGLVEDNKNLNEPDIEERFARLSLAFKTDRFTLNKRLDLQRRQRDIAEKNIEAELTSLRESLNALNQLCTETDMRDIITKTQQHVDIVQQATNRMSNRAETYGAIQQEERLNCAFETMLNYVEHLKLLYDKEHIELEEYRRLLAEHNLLPGEKGSSLDTGDERRTNLAPRSHSLSSPSKPELLRRGSVGAFLRHPHLEIKGVSRENNSGYSAMSLNLVRQTLENRTRLLSSVCLLNNNYESPRNPPNGNNSTSGSVSPKSRRASLPVGPLSLNSHNSTSASMRTHLSINEKFEVLKQTFESPIITHPEPASQKTDVDNEDDDNPLKEKSLDEEPDDKDSSDIKSHHLMPPVPACSSSMQDSACDNEIEEICLLPEISIPIKPKPLYLLNLVHWASFQRVWRWDNATLILHARYTLSIMLATAAMLTFVLTFVPNQVLAHETKNSL